MYAIINLTQHAATQQQIAAGVVEPEDKEVVQRLLTFDAVPTAKEVSNRAADLALIAMKAGAEAAMIGGAPFLMGVLERELEAQGLKSLYSFTRREVVEQPDGEGGVRKISVFKHIAFYEADPNV